MDVVIIGAGGQGKVVLDILSAAGGCDVVGFLDADPVLKGQQVCGVPVLGPVNLLGKLWQQKVRLAIVAIGDNRTRRRHLDVLREQGFELVNAVHPSAVVSPSAVIGRNVVIAAQAAVCVEARVGDGSIINTAAVVDHECVVGVAAHVAPGVRLAGRVRVGDEAFVGIGATVIQCLNIGQGSVVGAGAVVTRDVPDFATVVGVPARVIKVADVAPADAGEGSG